MEGFERRKIGEMKGQERERETEGERKKDGWIREKSRGKEEWRKSKGTEWLKKG